MELSAEIKATSQRLIQLRKEVAETEERLGKLHATFKNVTGEIYDDNALNNSITSTGRGKNENKAVKVRQTK